MTIDPVIFSRRAGVLTLLVMLAALGLPPPAQADVGVAVDVGAIEIDEPLIPGGRYTLPSIGVRNPGTEPGSYTMRAGPMGEDAPLDPSWFAFSPDGFDLQPDERQQVEVVLELPTDAQPDAYAGLLAAEVAIPGAAAGVGAAAASQLTFTIGPASPLQALWKWLQGRWDAAWPWLPATLGMLLLVVVARSISSRFELKVQLGRR